MKSKELNSLQKAYYIIRKQQEEIESLKKISYDEPIVVVGLACRFPGNVNNESDFWKLLVTGKDVIKEVPSDRWNASELYDEDVLKSGKTNSKWGGFVDDFAHFDPDFFNISRAELLEMDPQQRLLLLTSYEALENSGFLQPDHKNKHKNGGVFVGIGGMDHGFYLNNHTDSHDVGPYLGSGNAYSVASGRLSNWFGWNGPSVSYDTACSSSLVSVHYACMHLLQNDCDVALAGGVNVLMSENVQISLSKAGMLSPDGKCKTFDNNANGYVRGEGCGMLVLKRLSDAIKDGDTIRGVISGSAIAQDGDSGGLTVPNRSSQERVIKKAIHKAGIAPNDIQYVEAHGTGTSLGDPIEIDALSQVLSEGKKDNAQKIPIGSVKTNIGHLEAAAGIAGIIKVILSIENGIIPKHLNCDEPSHLINWDKIALEVCQSERNWNDEKTKYAGVSSFGFAGTIGHMILSEAPKLDVLEAAKSYEVTYDLIISAKSELALADFQQAYVPFLKQTNLLWKDICYTAGNYRPHYDYYILINANDKEAAIQTLSKKLEVFQNKKPSELKLPTSGKKVILPNYPFQNTPFLMPKKKDDLIKTVYQTQWIDVTNDKTEIEQVNYLILSDVQKESSKDLLYHAIGVHAKKIKKQALNDVFLEEAFDPFEGETYSVVCFINSEETSYNNILVASDGMIRLINKLAASQNNLFKCLYLFGNDSLPMQTLGGVLKTGTLEYKNFNYKQFTLDLDDDFQVNSCLPYINSKTLYRNMMFTEKPRFEQISKIHSIQKQGQLILNKDDVYVISGGLGSLGRALAVFLISKGAEKIWLLSRHHIEDEKRPERKDWFSEWKNKIEGIEVIKCDCSDDIHMKKLHDKIILEKHKVGGIFHVAGMNKQQPLQEITLEDCDFVMKAKVKGALLFDTYSRLWNPQHFVLFSSIAAVWGSSHLGHYAAANSFLNGLVNKRKKEGLPTLSVNWSAWKGSYMLDMNEEGMHVLKESGVGFMEPKESLEILETIMISDHDQVIVCENDWDKFIPLVEINGENPFWSPLRADSDKETKPKKTDFNLKGTTEIEQFDYLLNVLRNVLKLLLQYPEEKSIDTFKSFSDLGVDSILAVRFVKKINQLINLDLSTNIVFNYPTLNDITKHVLSEIPNKITSNIEGNTPKDLIEEIVDESNNDWLDHIDKHLEKYNL